MGRGTSIREPTDLAGWRRSRPSANWPGGWGGGGRGGGDDQPSYGERLKRYRLGVLLALSSVVMLFISFTTAYVVRKAGAVWDPAHNDYMSNWAPLALPAPHSAGKYLRPDAEQRYPGNRSSSRRGRCRPGADRRHSRHSYR